ncbi:MAG: hypothetical protein HY894_07940 [Deltaproteobacteria bacterium]|nr:hypothetical protein [Deltaproteobacteria bacterium]
MGCKVAVDEGMGTVSLSADGAREAQGAFCAEGVFLGERDAGKTVIAAAAARVVIDG